MHEGIQDQNEKLDRLMDWLLNTVQGSTEFVKEQAPEVARDMVRYGVWWHGVMVAFFAVLALLGIVLVGKLVKMWRAEEAKKIGAWHESVIWKAIGISVLVAGILGGGAGGTLFHAKSFIMASIAPKLYILNECRDMISGRK